MILLRGRDQRAKLSVELLVRDFHRRRLRHVVAVHVDEEISRHDRILIRHSETPAVIVDSVLDDLADSKAGIAALLRAVEVLSCVVLASCRRSASDRRCLRVCETCICVISKSKKNEM